MGDISTPIEPEHFNFAHTKENQIRWLGLYGLRRSAASFILPFGLKRTKWLSFVSCLLNAGMVLTFVVIESA
jgi:hypothetical protein